MNNGILKELGEERTVEEIEQMEVKIKYNNNKINSLKK